MSRSRSKYRATVDYWLTAVIVRFYCHVVSCALARRGVGVTRPRLYWKQQSPARVGVVTRSVGPRSAIEDSFCSIACAKTIEINIIGLTKKWRCIHDKATTQASSFDSWCRWIIELQMSHSYTFAAEIYDYERSNKLSKLFPCFFSSLFCTLWFHSVFERT